MRHWPLLVLLLIPLSSAATLTGTVYDYSLQPVPGAVVQIDTLPPQTVVATDGTYTLRVPAGSYLLSVSKTSAQGLEEQAQASITVPETGEFTYDLILFQQLEEFEAPELDNLLEPEQDNTARYVILIIVGITIIILGALKLRKKQPADEGDLEAKLLRFIRQHKRTTQKDIRKAFPYAEATISLALSSLEASNKIKKIKKGRGNIITYNKVS
ncbi:carboxypeptidase regulatory-like domain-containing protein [Candidatus Woesearchaeota archaeon]|nr:carboxypeptidase regulatory-like domain-containing protein [Candidatus Woesearchaeota archaeon]